jgi:hypothetical protein
MRERTRGEIGEGFLTGVMDERKKVNNSQISNLKSSPSQAQVKKNRPRGLGRANR